MEMIVAVGNNGIIGHKGALPWHVPEDLRHFRELTMGHVVIMGKKTYESLPRRQPLPSRVHIVFTASPPRYEEQSPCVFFVSSVCEMDSILSYCPDKKKFVIGGASIFRLLFDRCHTVHWTRILADVAEGDCWFPWTEQELADKGFELTEMGGANGACEFLTFTRSSVSVSVSVPGPGLGS